MVKKKLSLAAILSLILVLSGCVARAYQLTRDRVDQGLEEGNRGYLEGQAPPADSDRKTTRTTQVLEVELNSPPKFEILPPQVETSAAKVSTSSKAGLPLSRSAQTATLDTASAGDVTTLAVESQANIGSAQEYKVQKGDTLQKISLRVYGTSKKWMQIYQANKNILSAPDKIYPGQTLLIPELKLEEAKPEAQSELSENLK